ncbi:DUF4242 domain-containing protein [Azospirillum sp.]|uniref:DUF4242 domain-containing protein n=1 Tax=Azospirillum sp. TaxID=34012 RepID=UPI002D40E58A|nr:DUF4242 domain-containing protein [Azospirillum sp.]HYD65300.1 DUF4242 domain-containing protein [Azospirillum sp.]
MTVYMAERNLKGISMDDLAAAQRRAIDTARQMSEQGTQVRYIRSMFVPDEGRCECLFAADDAETVRALNDKAGLPYTRVVEAMDLTPP